MTDRSLTKDTLNGRFWPFSIKNVRTSNTASSVIKRLNLPSLMGEERMPLCASPPMACLPALLATRSRSVWSLYQRDSVIGLRPLFIKTSASHPKDLVVFFTVLPQAGFVPSVSPLPRLSRPTSAPCRILLATPGILKQQ